MKLEVFDINGQTTGRSIDLPDEIFGIEPNEHVIYLAVKAAQASLRQGTHSSKPRNAVKGSTRKIKKQKGTGTARAGDIKNPLFKGGGRIFGPSPRDYTQKVNKKVKQLARNSAFSGKAAAGKVRAIESFTFDQPSTREYFGVLQNLEVNKSKTLFLLGDYDKTLYLSSRNIPNSRVMNIKDVGILDIMKADVLFISEGCAESINQLV
ncbi:MAG: 50S ribosomal protein L4 [Saprospirales bacterium]|nr:MAG: 50S ribosomal protein L4 [Saprospirales bacterium]